MKQVAIFRLQLFKASEIFIKSQVSHYSKFSPILVGRKLFGKPDGFRFICPLKSNQFDLVYYFKTFLFLVFRCPSLFVAESTRAQFKLLHAHFAIDAVMAIPLVKRLKVPLITTLHGMDVTRTSKDMIYSKSPSMINYVLFKRSLFKHCELFICVSAFIKQAAIKAGYPENKLKVHYIGIDTQSLTNRNGIGEDGLLVHVGRLVEKKGTTYLLKAFAQIHQSISNPRLIIIGDGPLKQSLMQEAKDLGIAQYVSFLGVQPNTVVLEWVRKAAVMVVPSVTAKDGDMEGFGIVNIEASAQGVPVVGFKSGGIPEAIVDGVTGLLAPERDVDGLANALLQLLNNPELRLKMGNAGRKNVEENFDIAKQTAKLETIYEQILNKK